ncbi:Uncharacterised protein [uncultured archaeon]|nr:Uncharacterised protein [uncultured archaeon]
MGRRAGDPCSNHGGPKFLFFLFVFFLLLVIYFMPALRPPVLTPFLPQFINRELYVIHKGRRQGKTATHSIENLILHFTVWVPWVAVLIWTGFTGIPLILMATLSPLSPPLHIALRGIQNQDPKVNVSERGILLKNFLDKNSLIPWGDISKLKLEVEVGLEYGTPCIDERLVIQRQDGSEIVHGVFNHQVVRQALIGYRPVEVVCKGVLPLSEAQRLIDERTVQQKPFDWLIK